MSAVPPIASKRRHRREVTLSANRVLTRRSKKAPVLMSVRHNFFARVARSRVWSAELTFVVNESCIRCKTMDCVAVCPVDCFYEGENMLVIHPDECIDCGVCEPECPVDAIKADTEPGLEKWLSLNAEYAKIWPNITVKKAPPADWKEWEGKADKLQYFSPNPGPGD